MSVGGTRKLAVLNVVPPPKALITGLADYEAGTWTPVLEGNTGGTFGTNVSGYYVVIGGVCHCFAYIDVTSTAGTSGNIQFTLPKRSLSTSATFQPVQIAYAELTLSAGYGNVKGRLSAGSSNCLLLQGSADATPQSFALVPVSAASGSTFLYIQGTYPIDP